MVKIKCFKPVLRSEFLITMLLFEPYQIIICICAKSLEAQASKLVRKRLFKNRKQEEHDRYLIGIAIHKRLF